MKKISQIALVMVITTVFVFLTACGGGSSDGGASAVEGKWTASKFEMMGQSFTTSELEEAAAGMGIDFSMFTDMSFEFSGDTVTVSVLGMTEEGTFSIDGDTVTVTIDGDPMDLELSGSELILDEPSSGVLIYFTK